MVDQDKQKLIASRVKEARLLAGLSQGQVAKLMKLHRPSISEVEAGNRRVTAEEISRLAEIFDVSTSYLMGEAPETIAENDPRLHLAARELSKLNADALDRLLRALAAVQGNDEKKSE